MEQLASAISFNIEIQYHINPEQGDWHNFTNSYEFMTII